jgi:hypothetical protein
MDRLPAERRAALKLDQEQALERPPVLVWGPERERVPQILVAARILENSVPKPESQPKAHRG